MAWADTLQDASFRGVRFDCERVSDSRSRQQVTYQAPYSDDALIEDLGADPRKVTLRAWITGDDYEQYRDALIIALDQTGMGEFIHPHFGRQQAAVTSYTVNHDVDTVDGCTVTIDFMLATVAARELFIPTPNTSVNVAALVMSAPAERLQTLQDQQPYFPVAIDEATLADQIRTGIKTARGYLNTVNSVINNALSPPDWINGILTDVSGLINAIPTGASVIAQWRSIGKRLQRLGALFNTDAHPEPLRHVGRSLPAAAMLSAAQAIITQQTQRATLSPAELVSIRNDVREQIARLIALERDAAATTAALQNAVSTPPIPLATQTQVARLKQAADIIQTKIDALIARRPPLQSRPVTMPSHLRLLAHRFYGNHTRATELARLNPDLINPAVIVGGEVFAYVE